MRTEQIIGAIVLLVFFRGLDNFDHERLEADHKEGAGRARGSSRTNRTNQSDHQKEW